MRLMVPIKANNDSEAGLVPDEKLLAEMGKYNEELVKAGAYRKAARSPRFGKWIGAAPPFRWGLPGERG